MVVLLKTPLFSEQKRRLHIILGSNVAGQVVGA